MSETVAPYEKPYRTAMSTGGSTLAPVIAYMLSTTEPHERHATMSALYTPKRSARNVGSRRPGSDAALRMVT